MIREISIKAALNGFIVTCGCSTIVFNDIETLTSELNRYLRNPDVVEEEYTKCSINSAHHSPQVFSEPRCETAPRPIAGEGGVSLGTIR